MAWVSGTISRMRVQPPIARLWASSARSSDQSSEHSPGGLRVLNLTCQCERVLKVGDLGTGAGREDVIVMLPLKGFVSGRSRRASRAQISTKVSSAFSGRSRCSLIQRLA